MSESTPESLMYQILARREEINRVAQRLPHVTDGVFEPVSLEMPKFKPAELGFLRLVSWLFVLYHEVGRVGVAFLGSRLPTCGLDPDGRIRNCPFIVQKLRTFLQHNLDPRKQQDSDLQQDCESWLRKHSGTPVPGEEGQWERCVFGLLSEALEFMDALLSVLRSIEKDESREEVCREWLFRIKRFHPPHSFDNLILEVAADMGRANIDAVRLRNRFYEKWTQELNSLEAGYEFAHEARRLIEQALLAVMTPVLPITGKDGIEEFKIPPGPRVGKLLAEARKIQDANPTTGPGLLEQLRKLESQGSD
jgi:hypothetical protein